MTNDDILARLTPIFRATFGDESLTLHPAMTARDVEGWDSAKMVTIILAVEDEFSIRMRSRDIDALRSVGDFVTLIRRLASASRPA
jgi:acyl carrier protein